MVDLVYILGTGASYKAGVPLMKDFVAKGLKKYQKYKNSSDKSRLLPLTKRLNLPFRLNWEFQQIYSFLNDEYRLLNSNFVQKKDLGNLETLFNTLIVGSTFSQNRLDKKYYRMFKQSLIYFIKRTIELFVKKYDFKIHCKFIQNIKNQDSALITFNYDLLLDWALILNDILPNYLLTPVQLKDCRRLKLKTRKKLLKLHGSLNWILNLSTNQIEIYKEIGEKRLRGLVWRRTIKEDAAEPPEILFIVPPFWHKIQELQRIESVWINAFDLLVEASNIYIIGYSFPETDYFFIEFFSIILNRKINRKQQFIIHIMNPDNNIEENTKKFFKDDIVDKYFKFKNIKFEDWVSTL